MTPPTPAVARETEGRPRSEAGDSCGLVPPTAEPVPAIGSAPLLDTLTLIERSEIAEFYWPLPEGAAPRTLGMVSNLAALVAGVEMGDPIPTMSRQVREGLEKAIREKKEARA